MAHRAEAGASGPSDMSAGAAARLTVSEPHTPLAATVTDPLAVDTSAAQKEPESATASAAVAKSTPLVRRIAPNTMTVETETVPALHTLAVSNNPDPDDLAQSVEMEPAPSAEPPTVPVASGPGPSAVPTSSGPSASLSGPALGSGTMPPPAGPSGSGTAPSGSMVSGAAAERASHAADRAVAPSGAATPSGTASNTTGPSTNTGTSGLPSSTASVPNLKLKASSDNIRPSKPRKKRSARVAATSSKAEIFAAKIASAVDEADSSDSDETFVYESNAEPPVIQVQVVAPPPPMPQRALTAPNTPYPPTSSTATVVDTSDTEPEMYPSTMEQADTNSTASNNALDESAVPPTSQQAQLQQQLSQLQLQQHTSQPGTPSATLHPVYQDQQLLAEQGASESRSVSHHTLNHQARPSQPRRDLSSSSLPFRNDTSYFTYHHGSSDYGTTDSGRESRGPNDRMLRAQHHPKARRPLSPRTVSRSGGSSSHAGPATGQPGTVAARFFDPQGSVKGHMRRWRGGGTGYAGPASVDDEEDLGFDDDFDDDDPDPTKYTETTPLRRTAHTIRRTKKSPAGHSPHNYQSADSARRYYVCRLVFWVAFGVACVLMAGFLLGFIMATSKPLTHVNMTNLVNVLVSDTMLEFDVIVEASNPGALSIEVDTVAIDIFARSSFIDDGKQEIYPDTIGPGDKKKNKEQARTLLLGTVDMLSSTMTFEGGFFSRQISKSVGSIRLPTPGKNATLDDTNESNDDHDSNNSISIKDSSTDGSGVDLDWGQKAWIRLNSHPFDLIVRGVLNYDLTFGSPHTVSVSHTITVDPNDPGV